MRNGWWLLLDELNLAPPDVLEALNRVLDDNRELFIAETGEIIKVNKQTGKVTVQGINFKFKHMKPRTENEIGEIKQFEAPIHHSNVKLN